MRPASVAVSLVTDLLHYLRERGCDTAALLRDAGIVDSELRDPDGRIASTRKAQLNAMAIRATNDPDLGLHMAETVRAGSLGLLAFVLMTCDDVSALLALGSRYFGLLMRGGRFELRADAEALTLTFEQEPGVQCAQFDEPRYLVESALLGALRQVQALTARPITPRLVTFRHSEPRHGSAEHRRCFGSEIRFGAATNSVVFPPSVGQIPVRGAHPVYHEAFLKQAEALQATLSRSGGVVERASRVAAARFRGTPPRLDMVASDLCMSTRSLQRALAAEGMTFSGIIEGVRRDLALGLLRQPGTTVTEVAFTLGFSEAASFTRAVRRWTGTTPSAVKAGAYTASAGHLTR